VCCFYLQPSRVVRVFECICGTIVSHPCPICLFSEDTSRISSSGVPSHDFHHNFCSACAVAIVIFDHLYHYFYLLTFVVLQLTGAFPCDVSVLDLHEALPWQPAEEGSTCCLRSLGVYTDGAVLCCRQVPSHVCKLFNIFVLKR